MVSEITKEFLDRMGFSDFDIGEKIEENGRVVLNIQIKNGRELIGSRGESLQYLQHLLRRVIARRMGRSIALDVDINSFRKIREDMLHDFAIGIRGKVIANKKAVELDPMSPFDRRVIHVALSKFTDVSTESAGEGYDRYIIVRPNK